MPKLRLAAAAVAVLAATAGTVVGSAAGAAPGAAALPSVNMEAVVKAAQIDPRRADDTRKVWQLRNSGSVEWRGYSLHRIDARDRTDCQTITDIPGAYDRPGPDGRGRGRRDHANEPGFCFVRFTMVDANGKVAFPGGRPLNFQLIVGD